MKTLIELKNKTILITGAAGFIGSNLVLRLLETAESCSLIGIDNLNDYYDPALKRYRLEQIQSVSDKHSGNNLWEFREVDIAEKAPLDEVIKTSKPSVVINLAAQGGVRYSITNPGSYIRSNLDGFFNILEACRGLIESGETFDHLVYASSSSVYGGNKKVPFAETDQVDNPVSLYAATKKSNELLAHSYSKLYNIPCTGLRFFTVYGPAGRPDMAYFSFTEKLVHDDKISIFNYGNCQRDFTFIDDIVEGITRVIRQAPARSVGDDGLPIPPYAIYNIGNSNPENLMDFVRILSEELIKAGVLQHDFNIEDHINLVPMQAGDVPITYADTSKLEMDYGFRPSTDLRTGLRRFAEWYAEYYLKLPVEKPIQSCVR